MQPNFYRSLAKNMAMMKAALHLDVNDDVVTRRFSALGLECALYYVEGMSNGEQMAQHVLRPLLACDTALTGQAAITTALSEIVEATETKLEASPSAALQELLRGQCLLLMDTCDQAAVIDLRGYAHRGVARPQTENVVVGPHEAFNESLRDNLTLLHRRLQTPAFICKMLSVGTSTSTQVALCYLNGICEAETVTAIENRLQGVALDYVMASGILEQLIEDDPYAPLPQIVATERPDRVVSFLMEGQAVLVVDGNPRALALPMSLWHLFHAPDDSYMRWHYGSFMRILRLLGALTSVLLPALFVSLVIYHPMTIPMTLLTSIMQSRTIVPSSLLSEAVLMALIFNLINESGTRIPGQMGSSLGLVSTLILGTAAVDAGLVSPLLIIVVALAGVGSFAMPDYSMSLAFRIWQVVLLIIAGFFGVTGLCYGLTLLLCWVASMESLGRPYLAPNSPRRSHNPDMILRAPSFRQRLRAYLANPAQMDRTRGRMRRFKQGRDGE